MPIVSIHFTPSRANASGISSMKKISLIWPVLIAPVVLPNSEKPIVSTNPYPWA